MKVSERKKKKREGRGEQVRGNKFDARLKTFTVISVAVKAEQVAQFISLTSKYLHLYAH